LTPLINEFNKCPRLDSDLRAWAFQYPEVNKVFFGEDRTYPQFVYELSKLKTIITPTDKKEKPVIEYGFSEDEIKTILDCYKDENWRCANTEEMIKEFRENAEKEKTYINNVVRHWSDYEVPGVDNGNYRISGAGIFKTTKTVDEHTGEDKYITKDVCRTPFVLCGKSKPLNESEIYYKIRFEADEKTEEFWASQSTLLSRKELKTLFLSKGINCPENNILMETVEYISRSIADFGSRLKKEFSSKRNGWNEDKNVFVIGSRAISNNGISSVLSVGNGKGFPELEKKGTLQRWKEGTFDILEYSLVRFKCYDALSAPLKSILGIESHATDHYGNTSTGKTFTAQVALSMIGNAEDMTIGAKSTAKGILVHIRDFSDLPILIDESSDAGEHLADLVYPLTSNKGRVKSTVDGQRDGGEEFHTTTMFTGEKPIRDCLTNSGQQYRVNELDDTLPDLTTKQINGVKTAIRENHGHIIELYIQKLISWIENGHLQLTYNTCFELLPENTSNIEGRSRSIFACIMTAGTILEEVFYDINFPQKKVSSIVKDYFKKCIQDNPVELEYMRALRVVMDWVHSDYGRFAKGIETNEEVYYGDKSKVYGFVDSIYIDIIGTEFTKKMKEEKFSPSKIKDDWWNQGISDSNDPTRKGTYRFKRGGKTIAGVRIRRSIAENLLDLSHDIDPKLPNDQDGKVKRVLKIVKFLTELDGGAKISAIRTLSNLPDIDDVLKMMCTASKKIMKINQDEYIYLN
jgi:uncharacterized protein (DUF927 family)